MFRQTSSSKMVSRPPGAARAGNNRSPKVRELAPESLHVPNASSKMLIGEEEIRMHIMEVAMFHSLSRT